jgi:hypothetical protein
MTFEAKSKPSILVEIDDNIHEALIRLGDHVPGYECNQFISFVASILLMTLFMHDRDGAIDAFERVSCMLHEVGHKKQGILWGEFIQLMNYFHDYYFHHDSLISDLENLIGPSPKDFPEEIFEVDVYNKGGYLKVS